MSYCYRAAPVAGVGEDVASWFKGQSSSPDAFGRSPGQAFANVGGNAIQAALLANPTTAGLLAVVRQEAQDAVVLQAGKNAAALFALAVAGGAAGGILFGKAGLPGAVFGLAIAGIAGYQIYSNAVEASTAR